MTTTRLTRATATMQSGSTSREAATNDDDHHDDLSGRLQQSSPRRGAALVQPESPSPCRRRGASRTETARRISRRPSRAARAAARTRRTRRWQRRGGRARHLRSSLVIDLKRRDDLAAAVVGLLRAAREVEPAVAVAVELAAAGSKQQPRQRRRDITRLIYEIGCTRAGNWRTGAREPVGVTHRGPLAGPRRVRDRSEGRADKTP